MTPWSPNRVPLQSRRVRRIEDRRQHPECEYTQAEMRSIVEDALKQLTPRERKLVEDHWGFYSGQPKPFVEMRTGVTAERNRQVYERAVRRMWRWIERRAYRLRMAYLRCEMESPE